MKAFKNILSFGTGISFLVMIGAALIQVIGRMIGFSPIWTEELTRFALLYLVAFGTGLSLLSGDLVNVDIVCDRLPKPLPRIFKSVSLIIVITLSFGLLRPAWKYFRIGQIQTSPSLGMRMDFVYFSMFLLLLSLGVCAAILLYNEFKGRE